MHTCSPSHRLKRSKHLSPRRVNASNENTTNMHHARRWNVTTSMVGLKMVTYTKISPKIVNPRDIAGECRRRTFQYNLHMQHSNRRRTFQYSLHMQYYNRHTAKVVVLSSWTNSMTLWPDVSRKDKKSSDESLASKLMCPCGTGS